MDDKMLNLLIKKKELLDKRLNFYFRNKLLFNCNVIQGDIEGHLEKARHNINFISDLSIEDYPDWVITGCYYAVYHATLALILSKGYSSKNHDATLCVLIKEFFLDVAEDEIRMINKLFLDKQDLNFYIYSKNQRETASYSGKLNFNKTEVRDLIEKTRKFVDKIEELLDEVK